MNIIKAPLPFDSATRPFVFLAGSIEMGAARDWQTTVCEALNNERGTILNPRRDDWDATWIQNTENAQFVEQVTWELRAQEWSDVIALHFEPATKSPITLLELGLFRGPKQVVHCPKDFWRQGNVTIACSRYGICQVSTIEGMINEIRQRIR